MSKNIKIELTQEEIKYIYNLLDVRYWKLDQHLQNGKTSFEIEVLLRESKKNAGLQNKFRNFLE